MKIRSIEIEATAEELRQSQSISEGLSNALRRAFAGASYTPSYRETDEDEADQEEEG